MSDDQFEFGGFTYEPEIDRDRLRRQLAAVRAVMFDGRWHTLADISEQVGAPQASVSARLRDLRKKKFGAYTVLRRRAAAWSGLYEYRLVLEQAAA
jgi:DNA-binding Lrp family transcriptional regulator